MTNTVWDEYGDDAQKPHDEHTEHEDDQEEHSDPLPVDDNPLYKPFGTGSRHCERIALIDTRVGMVDQLLYRAMDNQKFIDSFWLALVFHQYAFVLRGHHLDDLRFPLMMHKVGWIQCFDPQIHQLPADKSAPIIVSMSVCRYGDYIDLMVELEKQAKEEEEARKIAIGDIVKAEKQQATEEEITEDT